MLFDKVRLRRLAIAYENRGDEEGQRDEAANPPYPMPGGVNSKGEGIFFPVGKTDEEQRRIASQAKHLWDQGIRSPFFFVVASVLLFLGVMAFVIANDARAAEFLRSIFHPVPTQTPIILPTPQSTELEPLLTPIATRALIPTATSLAAVGVVETTPVAIPSTTLNIRSGPGTEYDIVQTTSSGDRLLLIGRNSDGTWWNVSFNGISGWVLGELVELQNSDAVPVVVDYPPPPTTLVPEPTATPVFTPVPTDTVAPSPTSTESPQNLEVPSGTQELASFSQITLLAPGNLLLSQGASSSISIDAPENIRSTIYARVEGSTLTIGMTSSSQVTNASIQYRLSTPNVDAITILSTADVRASEVRTDVLRLSANGTGNVEIGNLAAQAVVVNIGGTGNITISAGEVAEQNVRMDGTGNYYAGNLRSNKATIQVDGPATATVWVDTQLDATVSGIGTIEYYGLPTVNNQTITNLGKIESLGAK
jgi:uncharacterized protein YraI